MAEPRTWTYYRFDPLPASVDYPIRYFRSWRGFTDRLDPQSRAWVRIRPDYLSHYLENGEVGLDVVTCEAVELAVGFALPD